MSIQGKHILAEALKLPPMERAELIENLFASFEFQSRKTIDALWAKEAEDRIDAFERGEMTAISAEEVFAKIDSKKNNGNSPNLEITYLKNASELFYNPNAFKIN